jgi:hypothetical protein
MGRLLIVNTDYVKNLRSFYSKTRGLTQKFKEFLRQIEFPISIHKAVNKDAIISPFFYEEPHFRDDNIEDTLFLYKIFKFARKKRINLKSKEVFLYEKKCRSIDKNSKNRGFRITYLPGEGIKEVSRMLLQKKLSQKIYAKVEKEAEGQESIILNNSGEDSRD